jgi:hypothetical protein
MLVTILNNFDNLEVPEECPALVFHCRTGKGRTMTAMAIAGLFLFHKRVCLFCSTVIDLVHQLGIR